MIFTLGAILCQHKRGKVGVSPMHLPAPREKDDLKMKACALKVESLESGKVYNDDFNICICLDIL